MPPKKATQPIVVGTVSTRSTKRQSVVNIEIIPKPTKSTRKSHNKSPKGSSKSTSPRGRPKKKSTQSSENELDNVSETSNKSNPAVLDLLKDWSDEDDSSPESTNPASSESSSDYHIVIEESSQDCQEMPETLSSDQQNLIDILEGTSSQSSPKMIKTSLEDEYAGSSNIEIIEECVVDDSAVIIENPEDNVASVETKRDDNSGDSDVEIVTSKYKYSEIRPNITTKTRTETDKLPMKKRLLQVVLEKHSETERSFEEVSSITKSPVMEVSQTKPTETANDPNIKSKSSFKSSGNMTDESSALVPLESKTVENIENKGDNFGLSEMHGNTMEVCVDQPVTIEEVVGTFEVDDSVVELLESNDKIVQDKKAQSYDESVRDLERILSDEPEVSSLEDSFRSKMDISETERFKKEKANDTQNEATFFGKLTKFRNTPSPKNKTSESSDMPPIEDKGPGKKSTFSNVLTQLDSVPVMLKSKKSPAKYQRSISELSPRTRRSQKLLSDLSETEDKSQEIPKDKSSPGKLKKSISETSISESPKKKDSPKVLSKDVIATEAKYISESSKKKDNPKVLLKDMMDVGNNSSQNVAALSKSPKEKDISENFIKKEIKTGKQEQIDDIKLQSTSEISKMDVDVVVDIQQDKIFDIKSKPDIKKTIDSKSDLSSKKILTAAEILENIYHPKPQLKIPTKVEKPKPKLQTAEDILASIYNPKPQRFTPQTSPSDSSNSDGKKDNEPTTPIAANTFDFDEISSSSSGDPKKSQDKDEKDLTSASESENMVDVNASFGDLSLNFQKRGRGRPTKRTQAKTRTSLRNSEKEDESMDTSEINEDSNSGMQVDFSVDRELQNLDELKISTELPESTTRPKTPKPIKKISKNEIKPKAPKESKKKKKGNEDEKRSESAEDLRRSSRIKTIVPVKKKSHGLVKSKSEPLLTETESDNSSVNDSEKSTTPTASPKPAVRERKSRWSSIKEPLPISPLTKIDSNGSSNSPVSPVVSLKPETAPSTNSAAIIKQRMKSFTHLKVNQYKTDRQVSTEAREMICDCYLAEEDIQNNEYGCGEDCLNRLLMIECGEQCQVGSRCTNRKFQKGQMAPVEVFHTDKKGLGIKAAANIPYGEFILEYVGEVLGKEEFDKRAEVYSEDKNIHHYFMSLRPDAIIDATVKGNISRFINHSCEPNAETQKWTVNGELRIGFFSTRTILAGEEITFDYQFERYGREAQKCYCEAPSCRGWLGDSPDASEDEEEEEKPSIEKLAAQKTDNITASIESAISAALAKEFGTEPAPEVPLAGVEKKPEETTTPATPLAETPSIIKPKKKIRKDIFEDLDQLKEELEMLATTGLKNQQHTLKLSRLMVRAKDPEQRRKLLHILRRGELPCRRLFLDYHGLRLIHGYLVDAQQLAKQDKQYESSKLELLQTLAVLPIQNKTILIESKVLPAVEQMAGKNEDRSKKEKLSDTEDEIRFLAKKLLEGWMNLKESFRIPKRQRIEQMKEHEKEANKKFMESRSKIEEEENYRKNDLRYRSSWSRYKSEREMTNKKGSKQDDFKDKPSAEFLRISKQERRKLFALQMELKEHERRLKQREMWRQHEMNCMMIGADPRFTAPFDPSKGFQYVWNPSIGQWQALPAPITQTQDVYGAPGSRPDAQSWGAYPGQSMISTIPMLPSSHTQLTGLNIPGLQTLPDVSPQPPLPSTPVYLDVKKEEEDPSQVKFAGPIPPPVKLPRKWKCAKDKYGRPYYYHVKIRKSQWEPPQLPEVVKIESPSESSSSESSSLSSDSSSDSDSDGEIDDDRLLLEVRKQIESTQKITPIKKEPEEMTPSPDIKDDNSEEEDSILDQSDLSLSQSQLEEASKEPSLLDIRLKEQFNLSTEEVPPPKKKRAGLCTEIIISPRTEEDHIQFKQDIKRYKANKEKLKRRKEQILQASKQKRKLKVVVDETQTKKLKEKHSRIKQKETPPPAVTSEDVKKIKETFRTNLAGTVVTVLNGYLKPECKIGRIVKIEDFKHLARKLTHFVMLKELKHLDRIEDLECTDSVKAKSREYIKKYMSKFGETYYKRHDEPDFKD